MDRIGDESVVVRCLTLWKIDHVVQNEVRNVATVKQTVPIKLHELVETVVNVSSQKIIKGWTPKFIVQMRIEIFCQAEWPGFVRLGHSNAIPSWHLSASAIEGFFARHIESFWDIIWRLCGRTALPIWLRRRLMRFGKRLADQPISTADLVLKAICIRAVRTVSQYRT